MISNSDSGILLTESSSNNTIESNNVTSSLVGIQIIDSNNNTVKDNFLTNNSRTGVSIMRDSSNNTVKDNFLSNNSEDIVTEDSNNQIYNNEIKESEIHNADTSQVPFTDPLLTVIIILGTFAFMRKK
jgi:nitrous oxidase accessory protein